MIKYISKQKRLTDTENKLMIIKRESAREAVGAGGEIN